MLQIKSVSDKNNNTLLDNNACKIARLLKDPRFDGLFYMGVKTTGIYCRPICPATPKEENIEYFSYASQAIKAGYRPCLRCHPDSAPGVSVTKTKNDEIYHQCIKLFEEEHLEKLTLQQVCETLGISTRHLRNIFIERTGISPKAYIMLRRTLFAKKLLHQTSLSITDIAFASGFNSIRRFNDHFKNSLGLHPSSIRNKKHKKHKKHKIILKLFFRPPYDWKQIREHYKKRLIKGVEWIDKNSYGRTFSYNDSNGEFTAEFNEKNHCFNVNILLEDISVLRKTVWNIRRILDLDTDIETIKNYYPDGLNKTDISTIARIPGCWSFLEAGIRAILEYSEPKNIDKTLTDFIYALGESSDNDRVYFPSSARILSTNLKHLHIKDTLQAEIIEYSKACKNMSTTGTPSELYDNKKIKNEIIAVAEIYGLGNPDICLKEVKRLPHSRNITSTFFSPYRSYYYHQLYSLAIFQE